MSGTDVVRSQSLKVCDEIENGHQHSELVIFGITAAIVDDETPPTPSALLNASPQHRRFKPFDFRAIWTGLQRSLFCLH